MNINIFRRRFTPWSVDGTMLIGGKIFCDTLERPGHCLPAGRYKISLIPVRQMKEVEKKKKKNYERGKYEIVIKPVIQFRLATLPRSPGHRPRFVPGNGPFRLRYKSIILGKSRYTGIVTQTAECYDSFCRLLEKYMKLMMNRRRPCHMNLYIRDWGVDEIPLKYLLIFQ